MASRRFLPARLLQTLREILCIPVVPFAEGWLADALVRRFRNRPRIRCRQDAYGNLLFQYRPPGRRRASLCFQAHMDHPGLRLTRLLPRGRAEAEILGQLPPRLRGATFRFHIAPRGPGVAATVLRVTDCAADGRSRVILRLAGSVPAGAPGILDLPDLRVRGPHLHARGHDDTLGVAVLTHLLHEADRCDCDQAFDVLFTRAEEAGLVGACALGKARSLPLPPVIVTVEMPRARGEVAYGGGVVCRVGDSVLTFDAQLLAHLDAVAHACQQQDPHFRVQRRLAWAGRTEASQFALCGYRTAALCLATRNGHNIGPDGRPACEIVHANDLRSLVLMLAALIHTPLALARTWKALRQHFEARAQRLVRRLRP